MKNRKLVLSTNNINKVKEMKYILKDLPIEILSKKDLGLEHLDVIEDGYTLEENSIKKAKALSEYTDYMVMSDDSGLFVEALGGQPGVHSSRYAGEDCDDHMNNEKLLREMKDIENRNASFITVITLVTEEKEVLTIQGEVKGTIVYQLDGTNGFGYDPLFIPLGYDSTFGILGEEIKNKISHRARALEKTKELLRRLIEDEEIEDNSSK